MKFTKNKEDKFTSVTLKDNKLNTLNAPELKSEFVVINSEGERYIILDLSNIEFVDSSGLSAILTANRLCKNSNGSLVLTGLQENVQKLINISQLDDILNIVPSMTEAVDFVHMDVIEKEVSKE